LSGFGRDGKIAIVTPILFFPAQTQARLGQKLASLKAQNFNRILDPVSIHLGHVRGLIGVLALISAGYCFWLMTVPLSYDWVYAVVIGFVVSIGVFVISLISSIIFLVRLRRSRRASHALQIRPTI
jgi:uncharacterized membrane protein (DUF485 family)